MKSRTLLCSEGDEVVATPLGFGESDRGVRKRPNDGDAARLLAREVTLFLFQLLDQELLLSGLADGRRLLGLSWPMA